MKEENLTINVVRSMAYVHNKYTIKYIWITSVQLR